MLSELIMHITKQCYFSYDFYSFRYSYFVSYWSRLSAWKNNQM